MRLRISYVWSSSSVFKGRHARAEANAEPSQQTVTRKESKDLQTWEFKGWVVVISTIVELSAKLAASGLSPMLPQGGWVVSSDDFEAGDDEVRRRLRSLECG